MATINFENIPCILVNGNKLYHSRAAFDYISMFEDVFSTEAVEGARDYFANRISTNLVTAEQIQDAIEYHIKCKEYEKRKKEHEAQVEQSRKDKLMKFADKLIGIHIPEINATFTLPIDYSSLSKEALSTIGTGKPTFPVGYLRHLLEQPEVESEFTLWGGTRIYMQGALNSIPEVSYVMASRVNEAILDASKAYINTLNTIVPR